MLGEEDKDKEKEKDKKKEVKGEKKIKTNVDKYLTVDPFQETLALLDYKEIEFFSNDTINEPLLVEVVLGTKREKELFCATLQMCIIGFGGKQYNNYVYEGTVKDLKKLFNDIGVKYNNALSAQLEPQTLTPRRLIRIFRHQVGKYLYANKKVSSYLYNKYSEVKSEDFRLSCFPGAEHIISKREDAANLLKAYTELDKRLAAAGRQAGISERVKRVFLARGVTM